MPTDYCSLSFLQSQTLAGFQDAGTRELLAMQVYLLCQWINELDSDMKCDCNTLKQNSACYTECMSQTQMQAAILYLLCTIANMIETEIEQGN